MRHLIIIVASVALGLGPLWQAKAYACGTCGCGDPTLTAMGVEKPYLFRTRLSLEGRYLSYDLGTKGVDQKKVTDTRATVAAAFAPLPWLFVSAFLPVVHREIEFANLATQSAQGIGELEVRARAYVWQDRNFWPRHLFALQGGMKLPTAQTYRDAMGKPIDHEAQIGSGTYDPLVGFVYSYFDDPFSIYLSTLAQLPMNTSNYGLKMGRNVRTSLTAQWQALESLALRLSADSRIEARATYLGVKDDDSGGFMLFMTPQLLWQNPWMPDLYTQLSLAIPTIDKLNGTRSESWIASLAVILDL